MNIEYPIIDPLSDIIISKHSFSLNSIIFKYNKENKEWEEHYGQIISCNTFQELINEMKQKISNKFIFNNILSSNGFVIINYNRLNVRHKNMVHFGDICPSENCSNLLPAKKVIMYGYPIGVFEYYQVCVKCHNLNNN